MANDDRDYNRVSAAEEAALRCDTVGCDRPAEVWTIIYCQQAKEGDPWPVCRQHALQDLGKLVANPPDRGFIQTVIGSRGHARDWTFWRPYVQVQEHLDPALANSLIRVADGRIVPSPEARDDGPAYPRAQGGRIVARLGGLK